MLSKLHKQAIVTGQLDNYCLVCEEHLLNDELEVHTAKQEHLDKRTAINYTKDFEEDFILKIKKRYYCICCNILLTTGTKVGLHVKDDKHVNNKGIMYMKRSEDTVLIKKDIKISRNAWNGFICNNCVLCDVEVDDVMQHETETDHILNLVQSQVQFCDENVFRKIDDNSFHCLTCNKMFPMSTIKSHFDSSEHKISFTNFKSKFGEEYKANATQKIGTNGKNEEKKSVSTSMTPLKEKKNYINTGVVLDLDEELSVILHGKYGCVIDDDDGEPYCLTCDWKLDMGPVLEHLSSSHHQNILKLHKNRYENSVNHANKNNKTRDDNVSDVKETNNNVEHHPSKGREKDFDTEKSHGMNQKAAESGKKAADDVKQSDETKNGHEKNVEAGPNSAASGSSDDDNLYHFVKKNDMEYDMVNNKVCCNHCHANMIPSWKIVKSHATSTQHKLRNSNAKLSKKVPMCKFIKQLNIVESPMSTDYVVNQNYVVTWLSLLMITKEDDVIKCACCKVEFSNSNINFERHIKSHAHIAHMRNDLFISSMDSEFLREILPDTYHCGFCNKVYNGEDELNRHLTTSLHCEAKNYSLWRLQRYLPVISENNVKNMHLLAFLKQLAEGKP